jgi:hypothetical protein
MLVIRQWSRFFEGLKVAGRLGVLVEMIKVAKKFLLNKKCG